jgi:hypothetical protein
MLETPTTEKGTTHHPDSDAKKTLKKEFPNTATGDAPDGPGHKGGGSFSAKNATPKGESSFRGLGNLGLAGSFSIKPDVSQGSFSIKGVAPVGAGVAVVERHLDALPVTVSRRRSSVGSLAQGIASPTESEPGMYE